MSIERVKIENFKNLADVEVDLKGSHLLLIGDNEVGKSSFQQAIDIALGVAKAPQNAIKEGEKEGNIQVVAGADGTEYTFVVKLKENGKHVVEVTGPDGIRDNRKSVIGQIVGELDFDVFEFVKLSESTAGRKKQVEIVKSFLPEEVREDLNGHERKIQMHFEDRTELNREAKTLEGAIEQSGMIKDDFDKYTERIDVTVLNTEYEEGMKINGKLEGVASRAETRQVDINDIEEQINQLQAKAGKLEEEQKGATEYLKDNSKVDLDPIKEKLATAGEHNEKVSKVEVYKKQHERIAEVQNEAGEMTALINSSKQALADAIKDIGLPVEGLEFDADQLLLDGRTVSLDTLSTSQIMHIGVQLKMAKNPHIKVLNIAHGESLGEERFNAIVELANTNGYQIIMEQVERGQDELKFELFS